MCVARTFLVVVSRWDVHQACLQAHVPLAELPLLDMLRRIACIAIAGSATWLFVHSTTTVDIRGSYGALARHMHSRADNVGLITVSNHLVLAATSSATPPSK